MGDQAEIDLERWLTRGAQAARRGELTSASTIFRALTRIAPHDRRAWIGLSRVAPTLAEREAALHQVALLGESTLPPALSLPTPAPPADTLQPLPPEFQSHPPSTAPTRAWRGRTITSLMIALVMLLLAGGWWLRQSTTTTEPTAVAIPSLAAIGPLPSPRPPNASTAAPFIPTPSPFLPAPLPTATPAPSALAVGHLVAIDNWRIGLLRPNDVVVIDGALGTIQPTGQMLIALLAVSNESARSRILPRDLFAIEDDAGQRHFPIPDASTRYLDLFGRGLYGDLALEEPFAPHSGLRSIPILFDLPLNRAPVRLLVGDEGWIVRQ